LRSKPTVVTANEGIDIVGKLICLCSKPTAVMAYKGINIAGELICLRSKPTAVTANEGKRLRASNLFFIFLIASQMAVVPRGHRRCGQAT
jgi:hypothetical protein